MTDDERLKELAQKVIASGNYSWEQIIEIMCRDLAAPSMETYLKAATPELILSLIARAERARNAGLEEAANLAKSWADIPCVETVVPIAVESASGLILRLSNAILALKTKPALAG